MRALARTWNRFWFAPVPTSTVALFRIALGIATFAWAVALGPNLSTFFGPGGLEPMPVDVTWGVLGRANETWVLVAMYVVLLASAAAVTVGLFTRAASVTMFVAVFSFVERSPSIFNSGDGLLRILTFLLVFMPAGAMWSLDARRSRRRGTPAVVVRPVWALRLVQIQVSVLYASAVWTKVRGGGWTDGTAMSYVWRMGDITRFALPDAIVTSSTASSVVAYLTLAVELMLAVLIWVPSARPVVIGLGVLLHLGIDVTLRIGFFSILVTVSYVAFLAPTVALELVATSRRWVSANFSFNLGRGRRARA